MDVKELKELTWQVLIGAIYGAAGVLATTQNINYALLSALCTGILKGIGHKLLFYLKPEYAISGYNSHTAHWSEKWQRRI